MTKVTKEYLSILVFYNLAWILSLIVCILTLNEKCDSISDLSTQMKHIMLTTKDSKNQFIRGVRNYKN